MQKIPGNNCLLISSAETFWNIAVLYNSATGPRKYLGHSTQKMKFFIKDFFGKCDQICRFRRIWSHLLKKSLMENFILCGVTVELLNKVHLYCIGLKLNLFLQELEMITPHWSDGVTEKYLSKLFKIIFRKIQIESRSEETLRKLGLNGLKTKIL